MAIGFRKTLYVVYRSNDCVKKQKKIRVPNRCPLKSKQNPLCYMRINVRGYAPANGAIVLVTRFYPLQE